MAETIYPEHRLVLRQIPGWDAVNSLAQRAGWQLLASNEGRGDAEYKKTLTWGVAPELWVTYIEDRITGISVAVTYGVDQTSTAELAKKLTLLLSPWSREELLEPFSDSLTRVDVARRLVGMALAGSHDFDHAIFDRISAASQDQDPEIRNAAAWSTVYLSWPQTESMLHRMAESDPDERVRNGVRTLLNSSN
ncbi:hypothetical protein [Streptomyces sp. NPDC058603]|uniref:hypothetical protein n=1 Tax=unclassified Streptomyces TaxID=2593676 RepID=UPI00365C9015